jgi:hypothetical protein
MELTPLAPPCSPGWPRQFWRGVKGTVVFLIVVFHLVVLAIRNPLDLWNAPIRDWVAAHEGSSRASEYLELADRFTLKYTNLVGCEQRWVMFSPPMARSADFIAYRLEFTDGSSENVHSFNEPDPMVFFRVGGWQYRKLEDYLLEPPTRLATDPERPLWEACARHAVRTWQEQHPNDRRTLARVVFLRRRISFLAPGSDPPRYEPAEETTVAAFDAQGRLLQ